MSAVQKLSSEYITEHEYLECERKAAFKSEYYQGEIHAMAGGSSKHSAVGTNVMIALGNKLRGRCRVFNSDMRVCVRRNTLYTYPDISVVCGGKPEFYEGDCLLNPTLIVEVLSPSTERYDRSTKMHLYGDIPSLQEYVLVAPDNHQVDIFRKSAAGRWEYFPMDDGQTAVELVSVGCTLTLEEIYENTDFDELTDEQSENT